MSNQKKKTTTDRWVKRYRDSATGESVKPEDVVGLIEEHKDDPLFLKTVKNYAEKARLEEEEEE